MKRRPVEGDSSDDLGQWIARQPVVMAAMASPTLSERAITARREGAEAQLSNGEPMLYEPALSPRGSKFRGYSEDFAVFWALYPRKEGKGGASGLWRRLSPADQRLAYNALKSQLGHLVAKMSDPDGNFCPMAATWLRERRFDDEISRPHRVRGR